jgi:hypothetical protein
MKTKLFFLVMLLVCISCATNNKPVSDAEKDKIKGEVKEVVNTILKGAEEANFDLVLENYFDSPDFVLNYNGNSFSYKQCEDMAKSVFGTLKNQKITVVDEKYAVFDNSTVMVTVNCKSLMNYKDGHSVLQDPWISQMLFKKIDNKWKVISGAESGIEQSAPSESSKGLNQIELIKQFVGSWKFDIAKDTIGFADVKSYGTGLESTYKVVTKGKVVNEGKLLWGYDKNLDKSLQADISKGNDIRIYSYRFISNNKYEIIPYDFSNPAKTSWKCEGEFKSPDIFVETTIENNKPSVTVTFTRVK